MERFRGVQATKLVCVIALTLAFVAGCSTNKPTPKENANYFTSGSGEADRRGRADVPEKGDNRDQSGTSKGKSGNKASEAVEEKHTLYDRLGGESGIRAIVDDFLKRAMEDPRVNWSRQGVTSSSWFRSKKSVTWAATPENLTRLKNHFVQFISLAAGGPPQYDGRPLQPVHAPMQIKKAEFEAAIGDLKASLDKLGISPEVQKELLSIIESTRPQIMLKDRG